MGRSRDVVVESGRGTREPPRPAGTAGTAGDTAADPAADRAAEVGPGAAPGPAGPVPAPAAPAASAGTVAEVLLDESTVSAMPSSTSYGILRKALGT
ncbi:hypothetical protein ABZ686_30825, partial [Streptomyces sp. NPDC006992]